MAFMNMSKMDSSHMGHNMMDTHTAKMEMDHAAMDHSAMDHASMDHSAMDHGSMDHSSMDHASAHAVTDHSAAGHGGMYFHFSESATILFHGWQVSTWEGMLGSCIAVFFMAALYEGLKVLRENLLRRSNVMVRHSTVAIGNNADSTLITETHKTVGARILSGAHIVQTLMHVLQVVMSYFLMLIFMTYNGWLCISVALGAGTGYFLFSWKRAIVVDINEHCH